MCNRVDALLVTIDTTRSNRSRSSASLFDGNEIFSLFVFTCEIVVAAPNPTVAKAHIEFETYIEEGENNSNIVTYLVKIAPCKDSSH